MLRISKHYISRTVFLLFSTEAFVLTMVFYISAFLRFPDSEDVTVSYETFALFLPEATTFTIIMTLSMAAIGMYRLEFRPDIKAILTRLVPSIVLSFGLMTLIFYLLPDLHFGHSILGIAMFLALPALLITRCILLMWFNLEILEYRAVVSGTDEKAKNRIVYD